MSGDAPGLCGLTKDQWHVVLIILPFSKCTQRCILPLIRSVSCLLRPPRAHTYSIAFPHRTDHRLVAQIGGHRFPMALGAEAC